LVALACGSAGAQAAYVQPNRSLGRADAAALLDDLPLPAGAMRSMTEPPDDEGILARSAVPGPPTPNLVDDVGWWSVPHAPSGPLFSPEGTLYYIATHMPPGARVVDSELVDGGQPKQSEVEVYAWPKRPGVLSTRQLVAQVVGLPDGSTGLRVDAQDVWLTRRSPGDRVPAATTSITLTVLDIRGKVIEGPLGIRAAQPIARVAALLDALPVFQPDVYACPADFGTRVRLGFHGGPGSTLLAVADVDPSGCRQVGMIADGDRQPTLSGLLIPGAGLVGELQRALGLRVRTGMPSLH
jgi:hypothetical protein